MTPPAAQQSNPYQNVLGGMGVLGLVFGFAIMVNGEVDWIAYGILIAAGGLLSLIAWLSVSAILRAQHGKY